MNNLNLAARIVILLPALLLASCTFSTSNWKSTNQPGLYTASFSRLDGEAEDRITARAGEIIIVDIRATIDSGALNVALRRGGDTVWQTTLDASQEVAEVRLPVTEEGNYRIRIKGENASGSFHVTYKAIRPKSIEVQTNRNIDLFGLLMQFDLAPDALANTDVVELDGRKAQWKDWYRLAVRNYEQFQAQTNSSMIKTYRDLLQRGLYNDFFIHFLLQVDEAPRAKLREDTDPELILAFSKSGDRGEAEQAATGFLEELNRFYAQINFDSYLANNTALSERMVADVRRSIPPPEFILTMEEFYGKRFERYVLVPSLNIPTSMGFGKTHQAARAIYNIFGPFGFQSLDQPSPDPGFAHREKVMHLSVHEFGHSFVNPAVDELPPDLIKQTEPLYVPIQNALTSQGYPSWTIGLYEHFVRAGEVLIARHLGDSDQAARIEAECAAKGFIYLPQVLAVLEQYDRANPGERSYEAAVAEAVRSLKPVPGEEIPSISGR